MAFATQAANRILLPAGILVSAARGYSVSSAIFGTYGKVGVWPCSAPFNQNTGVTGDLAVCTAAGAAGVVTKALKLPKTPSDNKLIKAINQAYNRLKPKDATSFEVMQFHVDLFQLEVKFRLGEGLRSTAAKRLRQAKETVELEHYHLARKLADEEMSPAEFVKAFNKMTHQFQDDVGEAVNKTQYKKLLDLDRDERVVLADPDVVKKEFGERTAREVYGDNV